MKLLFFKTVKSKVIISLFETVRLSVSVSLRNLYNSLNSIKESKLYLRSHKANFNVIPSVLQIRDVRHFVENAVC